MHSHQGADAEVRIRVAHFSFFVRATREQVFKILERWKVPKTSNFADFGSHAARVFRCGYGGLSIHTGRQLPVKF
jgi:hypothetical protein